MTSTCSSLNKPYTLKDSFGKKNKVFTNRLALWSDLILINHQKTLFNGFNNQRRPIKAQRNWYSPWRVWLPKKERKKNQSSLNAGIYQGKGSFQIMFGGFCPWKGVGGLPQSPPKTWFFAKKTLFFVLLIYFHPYRSLWINFKPFKPSLKWPSYEIIHWPKGCENTTNV